MVGAMPSWTGTPRSCSLRPPLNRACPRAYAPLPRPGVCASIRQAQPRLAAPLSLTLFLCARLRPGSMRQEKCGAPELAKSFVPPLVPPKRGESWLLARFTSAHAASGLGVAQRDVPACFYPYLPHSTSGWKPAGKCVALGFSRELGGLVGPPHWAVSPAGADASHPGCECPNPAPSTPSPTRGGCVELSQDLCCFPSPPPPLFFPLCF